jgi:hypothetical protein
MIDDEQIEEIDFGGQEDITMFTDDEHIVVKHINFEFVQNSKMKGELREFTVFNDIHCYQKVTRKHRGKKKFRVNLAYMDPMPQRQYILADSWLFVAAISAVVSFLLIYVGWFSEMQVNSNIMFILTSLSITFCLLAVLVALLKTQDRLIMHSRFGRAPILEFINNNPDHESFQQFSDMLSRQILLASQRNPASPKEILAQELKELRRLTNESVIPALHYERAKKQIFRNKAFKTDNGE